MFQENLIELHILKTASIYQWSRMNVLRFQTKIQYNYLVNGRTDIGWHWYTKCAEIKREVQIINERKYHNLSLHHPEVIAKT